MEGEIRTKRTRDPEATREAILEAARTLLAKDGPEGVSLSEVAKLAGVNRGTAYQHFETREKLIAATADSVSDKLFRAVFGDPETVGERRVELVDVGDLSDRLASFAVENPELGRIWLLQLIASEDPSRDMFWREYHGSIARFALTELAEDAIDTEVASIIMLAGTFLWPIWSRSHSKSAGERKALARRFCNESLRYSMYGTLNEEKFPQLAQRLKEQHEKQPQAAQGVPSKGLAGT